MKLFFLGLKIGIFTLVAFTITLIFIIRPLNINMTFNAPSYELTREDFLEQITPHAVEIAEKNGIRPSLLVAQAALESNWGNSSLAKNSNNYFGIKSATGKSYATTEYENDEKKDVNASFKEYASLSESIEDYALLLNKGTSWNPNLYSQVIDAKNYQEAAIAIQKAGYATDPVYSDKLIELIEQYELYELDK